MNPDFRRSASLAIALVALAACSHGTSRSMEPVVDASMIEQGRQTFRSGARYVGVTQMGGHGTLSEPRTGVKVTNGGDDQVAARA